MQHQQPYIRGRRGDRPSLFRRIIGWGCIGLGLVGVLFPAIPGLIFFVFGILLLGPYEPGLRRIAFAIRLMLRRWCQVKNPAMRRLGWTVRQQHRVMRLAIRSRVARFQRGEYRRRDYLAWLALFVLGITAYVGIAFAIHFGMTRLDWL